MKPEDYVKKARRIVVKIGSQLLEKDESIDEDFIKDLSNQIKNLKDRDVETLIVSSGAILAGTKKLGLKRRPKTISEKQAVSAVGQAYLMQIYDRIFSTKNLTVGQVLLTLEGLRDRKRYNYARQTLEKLLEFEVVPIINENDTVAVEEIVFGDNDFLAAHVSVLINADLLIILSTAGGVYTNDPDNPDSKLIKEIKDINEALRFAGSSKSEFGTGGMRSKLEASEIAVSHGISVVIAPKENNVILDIINGNIKGTFIHKQKKKYSGKKSWIALLSEVKGKVIIDKGAEKALKNGKSLLPAGIKQVDGYFSKGEVIAIENEEGIIIGKGISEYNFKELKSVIGKKNQREAVHTDNMVIFENV